VRRGRACAQSGESCRPWPRSRYPEIAASKHRVGRPPSGQGTRRAQRRGYRRGRVGVEQRSAWKRPGSDRPQQGAAATRGSPLAERPERQAAVDRGSCSRLTSRRSPVRAGHRPSSDASALPFAAASSAGRRLRERPGKRSTAGQCARRSFAYARARPEKLGRADAPRPLPRDLPIGPPATAPAVSGIGR